jgi:hypothetical protein
MTSACTPSSCGATPGTLSIVRSGSINAVSPRAAS